MIGSKTIIREIFLHIDIYAYTIHFWSVNKMTLTRSFAHYRGRYTVIINIYVSYETLLFYLLLEVFEKENFSLKGIINFLVDFEFFL